MPGPTNDLELIQRGVLSKYRRLLGYGAVENPDGFNIILASYDSWQAQQMQGNLERAGILRAFRDRNEVLIPRLWSSSPRWLLRVAFTFRMMTIFFCGVFRTSFVTTTEIKTYSRTVQRPAQDRRRDFVLDALRAAMSNGGDIMRPVKQSCPVAFIMADNSVLQSGADGKLVQTRGPLMLDRAKGSVQNDV